MANGTNALAQELITQLKAIATDELVGLKGGADTLQQYIAASLQRLSTGISEPGYQDMLVIERNNVALEAAGVAVDQADAADQRILGVIEGALAIGSKALTMGIL